MGCEQAGLVTEFDDTHRPPGVADPAELRTAAALPNVVRVSYAVPITQDFTPPRDPAVLHPADAEIEVSQSPHLPTLDGGTSEHDTALRFPSVKTSYYRGWQPYGPAQVATAYPAHRAILAVSLSVSYGTGG